MKQAARTKNPAIEARLAALRAEMRRRKLDAVLLTHAPDICHVTGFGGHDSAAIVTARGVAVVTDSRYTEELSESAPQAKLVLRKLGMADTVAVTLKRLNLRRIGFEADFATFGTIDGIRRQGRRLKHPLRLEPNQGLMVRFRAVKDEIEIQTIRAAVDVAEKAFLKVIRVVRPGMTEGEVAGRLILEMRSRGATDAAFQPIIAAGAHSSLPHYRPDHTPLADNQPLLIDWGALYQNYRSDLTRTVFFGKVNRTLARIYEVVLEANQAAIEAVRPGANCKDIDAVARKIITRAGYGKHFGHGLGHGIGRDIHEEPRLHKSRVKEVLLPGQIVTIEPGIYLPGIGGVRIEDDVLVTPGGHDVLSSLDKSFQWATQVTGG
jgi:Xaa-Pro aminopeptidase